MTDMTHAQLVALIAVAGIVIGFTLSTLLTDYTNALNRTDDDELHRIVVIMANGVIEGIDNVPLGFTIEVRDYDLVGFTTQEIGMLPKSEYGEPYFKTIYTNWDVPQFLYPPTKSQEPTEIHS